MAIITKKKKVMDVVADVVAKEVVTIPHKPKKMATLEGHEYGQVLP